MKKETIWVIDDLKVIRKAVVGILGDKYNVIGFGSAEEVLSRLKNEKLDIPDLILLDINMKKINGLELLRILKSRKEFAYIPFIIFSSSDSIDDKVKALELGASDYIVKPFNHLEFIARIKVHLKLKNIRDNLFEKTIIDPLTGVLNRRYLQKAIDRLDNLYKKHNVNYGIIFIDIDFFKKINDNYGHIIGDFALKSLVEKIRENIRKEDEIYRYGGEEFIVIALQVNKKGTTILAEKLRKLIEESEFSYEDGKLIRFTISCGVASLPDDNVKNTSELIELADKRLYSAKKAGRNKICYN